MSGAGDGLVKRTIRKHKAKKLGAAFKPRLPHTYTKSQTKPVYRVQRAAQEREIQRLMTAKDLTRKQAFDILREKYKKVGLRFLPKDGKVI